MAFFVDDNIASHVMAGLAVISQNCIDRHAR